MKTVKLSKKGLITLPSHLRARKKWVTGTEFEIVETADGVLLKPLSPFPATRIEDVFGMARYRGPKLSLREMDAAVRRRKP